MKQELITITKLVNNKGQIEGLPKNPRFIKDHKFVQLKQSIKDDPEMLELREVIAVDYNGELVVIAGNMRLNACLELGIKEVPCKILPQDTPVDKLKAITIKDNIGYGEHDWDALANDWEVEELAHWGLDLPLDFEADETEQDVREDNIDIVAIEKLTDKFIVPPFSVLNTREGYWQDRKKHWNTLIGDNGETRDNVYNQVNKNIHNWENKPYKGGVIRQENVSILDSVLAEVVNKWYTIPNSKTFDCFAGDTVFGYVSSYLGHTFTGIELREEQVNLNNTRVKGFNAKYICDDGRNVHHHIEKDSQDLLFSCPPYFNLEVYSNLTNDASNQNEYKDFISILDTAFSNAISCLKDNRFAVIVCGDVRDQNGNYYRFPDHIKDIFNKNGMKLYNELILIQAVGNGALRANTYMRTRKVVKLHEQVLVFYKGNINEIKNIYPIITLNESTDA